LRLPQDLREGEMATPPPSSGASRFRSPLGGAATSVGNNEKRGGGARVPSTRVAHVGAWAGRWFHPFRLSDCLYRDYFAFIFLIHVCKTSMGQEDHRPDVCGLRGTDPWWSS
jgi:hypothetical protein